MRPGSRTFYWKNVWTSSCRRKSSKTSRSCAVITYISESPSILVQTLHKSLALSADLAHSAHSSDPSEAISQQLARLHQTAIQRGVSPHRLRHFSVYRGRIAERGSGRPEILGAARRSVQLRAEGEHSDRFGGEKREEVGRVRGDAYQSRLDLGSC